MSNRKINSEIHRIKTENRICVQNIQFSKALTAIDNQMKELHLSYNAL